MANKQFNSVDGYSVGNANIVIDSNGNVSGNAITATANVTAPRLISNVATGTAPFVVTSTTQVANLSVATAGSATTAGTVTTAAQPNITSVGTLTSATISGTGNVLTVTGNIALTGTIVSGFGNGLAGVNSAKSTVLDVTNDANYAIALIDLTGSPSQVYRQGTGSTGFLYNPSTKDLDVGSISGTFYPYLVNVRATTAATSTSSGAMRVQGGVGVTGNIYAGAFYGPATGLTSIPGANVTGIVPNATALQGNTPSQTATANSITQRDTNGNITANFFIGNGSQLTGIVATVATISNGNSNVNIPAANGNVNISAVGNANIVVVTGTGANVNGTLTATGNVALSGANVSLGAVGNIRITGGTANQVLRSDGASGAVSWQTLPVTNIQEFTATGGQTTFTVTGTYIVGSVLVFVNGIQMNSVDYTASNGTTVVLTEARVAGDTVRVVSSVGSVGLNNLQSLSVAMSVALGM